MKPHEPGACQHDASFQQHCNQLVGALLDRTAQALESICAEQMVAILRQMATIIEETCQQRNIWDAAEYERSSNLNYGIKFAVEIPAEKESN